jgi:hypothetical protein
VGERLKKLRRFPSSAIICIASAVGVEANFEVVGRFICIAFCVVRTIGAVAIARLFAVIFGLGRKGKNGLLTLGANTADELFPLGGSQFGHCALDKLTALPGDVGTIIHFDRMGFTVEGAGAVDSNIRHKITSKVVVGHCPP